MRRWSHAGFHRQHYNYMLDRVQTELYRGRAREAWLLTAENWQSLRRTHLLRVQFLRIEASYLRARCALLMAVSGGDRHRFLAIARHDACRLARERTGWSHPLSCMLLGTVAYIEGKPDVARMKLTEAAAGFERAHMKLYLAVVRRRLGELAGRDGLEDRRHADEWMTAEGIVNASRIARLIAPGFAEDPERSELADALVTATFVAEGRADCIRVDSQTTKFYGRARIA